MSYSVSIEKRTNGGYTLVYDGTTVYLSGIIYHGSSTGVILFSRGLTLPHFYTPSEWTVQGVTGFTTVLQVVNALDALGVVSGDALTDMVALLQTIDADTGAVKTALEGDLPITLDGEKVTLAGSDVDLPVTLDGEKVTLAGSDTDLPVTVEEPVVIEDYRGYPTLLDIPDYVDTTDGTIIYQGYDGYGGISNCLIMRKTIAGALITTDWAEGDWSNRSDSGFFD